MCGSYSCRGSKIMDMYLLPFEAKEKMAFFLILQLVLS